MQRAPLVVVPTIEIESDYDGYFERLVRRWVQSKADKQQAFAFTKIVISAGPYRSSAVNLTKRKDGALEIDFYSALRTGFGSLSTEEVEEIIAGL